MKIQKLHLENFRCFEDASIIFDDEMNVFVGVNGAGKTALLEAIAILLGDITSFYISDDIERYKLNAYFDKSFGSSTHASVTGIFEFDNKSYKWTDPYIEREKKAYTSDSTNNTLVNTHVLVNNIRTGANTNPDLISSLKSNTGLYPIFAYYNVYRLLPDAYSSGERSYDWNRSQAYDSCFNPKLDFNKAITWLDAYDAEEARQFRSGNSNFKNYGLAAIRDAVNKAIPGFKGFRFINSPPEFVLTREKDGQNVQFRQLSDGYRAMLALILDLARRMAVANGEYCQENMLSILNESPAIVMIDEVDMHLHPSWQQILLPSLMDIFPNTQFIVTTHSPQVLTSIDSSQIRILKNGQVFAAPYGSEGAESSRLLKRILGVEVRPPQNKATRELEEYKTLVYADKWDSDQASLLRDRLNERYKGEEPELKELDLYIENRKWELGQ